MKTLNAVVGNRKGQNTVEYLMMLSVVVGVVLITGGLLKKAMPNVWGQIQAGITDTVGKMGSGN